MGGCTESIPQLDNSYVPKPCACRQAESSQNQEQHAGKAHTDKDIPSARVCVYRALGAPSAEPWLETCRAHVLRFRVKRSSMFGSMSPKSPKWCLGFPLVVSVFAGPGGLTHLDQSFSASSADSCFLQVTRSASKEHVSEELPGICVTWGKRTLQDCLNECYDKQVQRELAEAERQSAWGGLRSLSQ